MFDVKFTFSPKLSLMQYTGGRDESSFISFLNSKTGAQRIAGGLLNENVCTFFLLRKGEIMNIFLQAGRVAELDAIAAKFSDEVRQNLSIPPPSFTAHFAVKSCIAS